MSHVRLFLDNWSLVVKAVNFADRNKRIEQDSEE